MQVVSPKENKMGVMPINRLLITMSLPIMISMMVQALYNIVDSIFVAQINENALTAVSLAFPVQNLMIAVSTGTGVGVNAILSRSLGAKDQERANRTAVTGILLALASFLVFAVLGLTLSEFFFRVQTSDAQIIEYGTTYMTIVTSLSFGLFGQIIGERLLQATGRTFYTMITQGLGAIINIILDPIFIFGYLGLPAMGVAGAALATITGQIIAAALGFYLNHRVNLEIQVHFKKYRPTRRLIREIYAIGIPSILMSSIGSVMTFCMNKILIVFSTTATAVFGVYFKLQSFIFMPVFGLNNGMVPIISYNFGAQKKDRIHQTIRYSILYATLLMLFGFILFEGFPDALLRLFNASDTMLDMGRAALRIIAPHFLLAGFDIIASTVFQALGRSIYSLIVSIARQLLVLLPVALLLSLSGVLDLVWLAFPISEVASFLLCFFFLRRTLKALTF
ncbi:MAG: MATE family efflux transporter [Lachnospiraceae bacterium]|jgi:putative MATE family efflux protein|nr:MATE family efflux transporter [Lachnospiraceae bacterium]